MRTFGRWSAVLGTVLLLSTGVGCFPGHVIAQEGPLLDRLQSSDWTVRARAVDSLAALPAGARPAGYEGALVDLLEREVAGTDGTSDAEEAHGYGEYLLDVIVLVVATGRPDAVEPLSMMGIESAASAQRLVAEHPERALPALRESWKSQEAIRGVIVSTLGLMVHLADQGQVELSPEQRGEIDRWFLEAATGSGYAPRTELVETVAALEAPEWLPVVELLAEETVDGAFYDDVAREVIPGLREELSSRAPLELAERLQRAVSAACNTPGASGGRRGFCESTVNRIRTAIGHLEEGRTGPARNVLESLASSADRVLQDGAITEAEHALIAGGARQILERLEAGG